MDLASAFDILANRFRFQSSFRVQYQIVIPYDYEKLRLLLQYHMIHCIVFKQCYNKGSKPDEYENHYSKDKIESPNHNEIRLKFVPTAPVNDIRTQF